MNHISNGSLRRENILSLVSMPAYEANSQKISIPPVEGTSFIPSISPSKFQGGLEDFFNNWEAIDNSIEPKQNKCTHKEYTTEEVHPCYLL